MSNEYDALVAAVNVTAHCRCMKSRRGVAIFDKQGIVSVGTNNPPQGFDCDGKCGEACTKIAVHAEQKAILSSQGKKIAGADMLHVKVDANGVCYSGPPSCIHCAKLILDANISGMWLLHETGLKRYTATEFYEETCKTLNLPYTHYPASFSSVKEYEKRFNISEEERQKRKIEAKAYLRTTGFGSEPLPPDVPETIGR